MKKLSEKDWHHFIRAYEHAFEEFGGVPEVAGHDNLKSVVVKT